MNGLWTVEFGSSSGLFGGGVVVFQNGQILGGDSLYYYVGEYSREGMSLTVTIRTSPFIEGAESVFKTIGQELTLKLEGTLTSDTSAIAQGHAEGRPEVKFGAKLTKRV
jgi:T3SS negative regulator,GrlR